MKDFYTKVEPVLNARNAEAWSQTDEKFVFIAYLLGSYDIGATYSRVQYVEQQFERILDPTDSHPLGWAFAETETAPSNKWP